MLPRLALVLALLCAPPLSGQHVELTTGPQFFGPLVDEVDSRVRLGTRGQDMAFGVRVGGMVDWWGIEGEVTWTPTNLTAWPASGSGDLTARPINTEADEPVTWSCASVGPVAQYKWARWSAGAGICQLSSARHGYFGSAPMHAAGFRIGGRFAVPVTDGFDIGVRCTARPTILGARSVTVLRIASGEIEPGEHRGRQSTFWSGDCGVSFGVKP